MGLFSFLFGPSGEAKRNNSLMDQQRGYLNTQSQGMMNALQGRLGSVYGREDQGYNRAYQSLDDLANTQYDPSAGLNWGSSDEINADRDALRGFKPQNFDRARMRGGGNYEEFAKTGGYSPEQIAAIERQIGTSDFTDQLRLALARSGNVTGNQSGGMLNAAQGRAARQGAYGSQQALNEGVIGLNNAIRQGRQWGTQGMSQSEQALANAQAAQDAQRLQAAQAAGQLSNAAGQLDLSRANAQGGLALQGNNLDLQRRLGVASGFRGLRTDQPGESTGLNQNMLNLFGGTNTANQGNLNLRVQNNPNQSMFSQILGLGGAIAPLVSPFASGHGPSGSTMAANPGGTGSW